MDIQKFFDSVPWDLIVKAVEAHTDQPWMLLYIERWLACAGAAGRRDADRARSVPRRGRPDCTVLKHCNVDQWVNRLQHFGVHVDEQAAIEHLVDRLNQDYPDVSADTIVTIVQQNHARFDGRRIRDFVPLFVELDAKRELSQLSGLAPV